MEYIQAVKVLSMWEIVFFCLAACAFGYFASYLKEKGKLKAAHEDARRLEIEKQRVISEYAEKLEHHKHALSEKMEKMKQDHEVDFQKRKYKYEDMKREYFEFMDRMDSYHGVVIKTIEDELVGILKAYYESRSQQEDARLTVAFNDRALNAIAHVRAQESELFAKVNGLKLSASKEVLKLVADLTRTVSESRIYLEKCIMHISSPEFRWTGKLPDEISSGGVNMEERVLAAREALLEALRSDLDKL